MVFSSLFFVFFFFPACLLLHTTMPCLTAKNIVLLLFSLVFYAWSGPSFVLILVGETFVCWLFSYLESKARKKHTKKSLFVTNVILLLGFLCFFKYAMMLLSAFNGIFALDMKIPEIVLPIGISFYTFQLITYAADVHTKKVSVQKNFFTLLLYAAMFHQCIAGPIVRYGSIADEIKKRSLDINDFFEGTVRFSIGLAKKALLANACAGVADLFLPAEVLKNSTGSGILVGLLAYTLQIYLDFSAYSDMAIGMGLMMGLHFPENFDHPYVSRSVTEFWRRWHMTLGSFFRDYVYIPLGGSRKGKFRTIMNLFVVWGLTGLWHGAHANFILWGLYFFVFLIIEKNLIRKFEDKIPSPIRWLVTMTVVYFGWMLFYYTDFSQLGVAFKAIFVSNSNGFYSALTGIYIKNNIFILLFSIFACLPLYSNLRKHLYQKCAKRKKSAPYMIMWDFFFSTICIILSMLALIGDSYNPFLYFRF